MGPVRIVPFPPEFDFLCEIVLADGNDDPTGEIGDFEIVELYENETDRLVEIEFENQTTGKRFTTKSTPEHPFFVYGKDWIVAEKIQVGDECRSASDQRISVVSVTSLEETCKVYNFQVKDAHTYFVGETDDESVLVHNECSYPGCTGHGAGWVSGRSWSTWFWGQDHRHNHLPAQGSVTPSTPPVVPVPDLMDIDLRGGTSIILDGRDVEGNANEMIDTAQSILDYGGSVPGAGEILDLCNAGISWLRGDKASATVRALAAVPFLGAIATGPVFRNGGVIVRQEGDVWIKMIDKNVNWVSRQWGKLSLSAQARALNKLGDMAPNFTYSNGILKIQDVGKFNGSRLQFLGIWIKGSWRLGTPWNDIRPRNIGANGQIFDPAYPLFAQRGLDVASGGLVIGAGVGMYYFYEYYANK